MRRFLSLALCVVGLAAVSHPSRADAPAPAWRAKIAPRLVDLDADRPVEFLVVLADQARLPAASPLETREQRSRRVVERLRSHASASQSELVAMLEAGGVEYRPYWIANLLWVKARPAWIDRLAARDDVARVEANPHVALEPPEASEPTSARSIAGVEWNVAKINADQVWNLGYTGAGVVIGGQDTGYDWDHAALKAHYRGWDGVQADHDYNWHDAIHTGGGVCGPDSPQPCDDHSHGTHTMGTMVGDDGGSNRIGVAPGARWIGCRNMNVGDGTPASYTECFQWFVAPTDLSGQNPDPSKAPDVINNSWGCPPSEGCSALTLQTVVENVRAAGIVVVVSAGNSGSSCGTVQDPPAIYDAAFSVAATNSNDAVAGFSSRGPVTVDGSNRLKPDVAAPGVNVRSSTPNDGYAAFQGTSMAGPHVAGLVALLLDARPDLSGNVDAIEALIRGSALGLPTLETCGGLTNFDRPNNVTGWGRVDALALLTGDLDGDGVDNRSDCGPTDPSASAFPVAVSDLSWDASPQEHLAWSAPDDGSGVPMSFDVLRTSDASDPGSAACLARATATTTWDDPATPGPSGAFFYLVRARNACGSALGPGAGGAPRSAPTCP